MNDSSYSLQRLPNDSVGLFEYQAERGYRSAWVDRSGTVYLKDSCNFEDRSSGYFDGLQDFMNAAHKALIEAFEEWKTTQT